MTYDSISKDNRCLALCSENMPMCTANVTHLEHALSAHMLDNTV
jgi:hypothetical protein